MGTYIRCYKVITHPESWNDAALECGNLDPPAHLAIPDTSEVILRAINRMILLSLL